MKNRISVHEIFQRHSNVTTKIAIVSFYFVFNKWNFICKVRSQHLQLQAMVINLTSNEKTINSYLPATFQHITTCFTILFVRRASKTLPSTSLSLCSVSVADQWAHTWNVYEVKKMLFYRKLKGINFHSNTIILTNYHIVLRAERSMVSDVLC